MTSTPPADTILIDWGTTNARAYRLVGDKEGSDKAVCGRRRLPRGIRQVPAGGFPAALAELLGPWLQDGTPPPRILMSGMVGSRQGWVEASYRPCPARLADLAANLCPVPGLKRAHIVPGVCRGGNGAAHDVIRGEEVQVFGAVADASAAVLCLPGTHSKWVRYADGALLDFATAMTGEVFQVLRSHSLLGALMPAEAAAFEDAAASGVVAEAFRLGLDRSAEPGGLLHHLFGVRAEGLFGAIPPEGLEAYLSGLLIGHEIRAMAGLFPTADPVRLVADGALAGLYTAAFRHLGRAVEAVDVEAATIRGLTRILEQAGPLA
jgi:2-dehydro-3-deoxygalactonokinase